MTQRLFQDVGGTTPAIIAGQPVGLIKRLAGSVDAVQATALSKPTLARWPKGGVRNLAMGAQAVTGNSYWPPTSSNNGVTVTRVGTGIDTDGLPYVDISYVGVATVAAITGAFAIVHSRVDARIGDIFHAGIQAKLVGGSLDGVAGFKVSIVSEIDGAYLGERNETKTLSADVFTQAYTEGELITATMNKARCSMGLVANPSSAVDVTIRYKGLFFGRGLSGIFQYNYGPNDITERGVADLWHLYNDGGDSLNVTLPAGTYSLASIDINRAITVTTITSDGTTPINTLRHERQLDVILRAGVFSAGEETAIRDYWGRVFA